MTTVTKSNQTWVIRDGDEKDLEGIASLRETVFGEMEKDKLDPNFWRWEFLEGPDGKALIYIVEDGGRVVGHFADIPRRFSVDGKIVLGTISVDLMVHPDHRRKGLFSKMGRFAAQRVKKEKGLFMAAFPIRKETIVGLQKLGWQVVAELPVLVYPIRFGSIVKRYLHFSALSQLIGGFARVAYLLFRGGGEKEVEGIAVNEVTDLDDRFDQFLDKGSSLYPVMGVRNRAFLEWRYLQHPSRTYAIYRAMKEKEMGGYIVLRKVDLLDFNSAVIVDLLAMGEDFLKALVKKGIEYSRDQGADLLGCMLPKGHAYHKMLRALGFLSSPKRFLLMVYRHSEEEISLAPEKWYVNWGDTDVI